MMEATWRHAGRRGPIYRSDPHGDAPARILVGLCEPCEREPALPLSLDTALSELPAFAEVDLREPTLDRLREATGPRSAGLRSLSSTPSPTASMEPPRNREVDLAAFASLLSEAIEAAMLQCRQGPARRRDWRAV